MTVTKLLLIVVGIVATALALLGAVLPGLPTTPFLLVALWAFARSSERLHAWLMRVPILQTALQEAKRFEEKRALRPAVKLLALGMAWGSVLITALTLGTSQPMLVAAVTVAALAATLFVALVRTDR